MRMEVLNFDLKNVIPAEFDDSSRVWIYQSSRLFTMSEAFEIEDILNAFVEQWNSHGTPVKGYGNLLFGQFIIFMADEKATGVSGCSTDSSVRIIKQIEEQFKVNMFERTNLAFLIKEKVQLLPLAQLNYAFENGFINSETIYFNNLAATKKELLENWMIPVKDSWLWKRINHV
jgi:hypothetical protein